MTIGMIIATHRLQPLPERYAEVLEVLRSVQGPMLAQPGCAGCHIYEEHTEEQVVVLVESWESEDALDTHLRSEIYRRILGAIELSGAPPEVRFDYVSATDGMGLIERARSLGRNGQPLIAKPAASAPGATPTMASPDDAPRRHVEGKKK